jgi:hypothetical protein
MYRNTLIWSDQGVMLCQGLVMKSEEGYRLSDGRLVIRAALLFAVLLCFPPVASAQESQCFDFVGNGVFDGVESYLGGTLTFSETVTLVYDVYSVVVGPGSVVVDRGLRYILGDDEYAVRACSGSPVDVPWDQMTFHAVVFFGILCSGFLAVLVVRR